MFLTCPLPATLKDIPASGCPFRFDQIVRIVFQRRRPVATPAFATLAALQTKTNWTTNIAASDDTKMVVSPIFSGCVIPRSTGLTTGGNDNSTFAGIREYNGEGAITVTGTFKNLAPASFRAMKYLSEESLAGATGVSNLTAFLVNRDGNSFQVNPHDAADAAVLYYQGIPVYNFRVSSPGSDGFNAPNVNDFSFDLKEDWADFITAVKPTFDLLTEI
jgi:hypothetical protein